MRPEQQASPIAHNGNSSAIPSAHSKHDTTIVYDLNIFPIDKSDVRQICSYEIGQKIDFILKGKTARAEIQFITKNDLNENTLCWLDPVPENLSQTIPLHELNVEKLNASLVAIFAQRSIPVSASQSLPATVPAGKPQEGWVAYAVSHPWETIEVASAIAIVLNVAVFGIPTLVSTALYNIALSVGAACVVWGASCLLNKAFELYYNLSARQAAPER